MKKAVLMFMSLAIIFSSMASAMAAERVPAEGIPSEGYEFVDIAYDGDGTIVAMAKEPTYTYAQLLYSNDNGLTWKTSENQPFASNSAAIYSNKKSQQQLIWWDAEDMFVVHGSSLTYTSPDGISWSNTPNIHWTSNTVMTDIGNNLIFGGEMSANATNDVTQKVFSQNKFDINLSGFYVQTVGAKPADADGNIEVMTAAQYGIADVMLSTNGDYGYIDETLTSRYAQISNEPPYDMVYAEGADQFLYVDGTKYLMAASDVNTVPKIVVKEGVNVTGVNASDKYIAVGMSDGTMYYTENAPITADTVWTQVPDMNAGQAIKNIEFIDDTNFVALGTTAIYKGSLIPETEPQVPEITQPVFGDVTSSDDGYFAKTATFTLTPNGNTNINVRVAVNDQDQTKTIENIESEIKFGIIVIGDDEAAVSNAGVSVSVE